MKNLNYYYWQDKDLYLNVHIQPNAKRNVIVGIYNDRLKIALAAPPVSGKANQMLINFLAEHLKIPKKSIQIGKGLSSKTKLVVIKSASQDVISKL